MEWCFPVQFHGYIECMSKPKKAGPGRPPAEVKNVRLSVDIRPDLREKVDALAAERRWLLNVTVEAIIEAYFADKK